MKIKERSKSAFELILTKITLFKKNYQNHATFSEPHY
jgi:hypothetical protein